MAKTYIPLVKINTLIEQKEAVGLIQGIKPASMNEWWVYRALMRLGYDVTYQYPLYGGRDVRGGQVLDFVVWTRPKPIAIFVGTAGYWHTGARALEDEIKKSQAERAGFLVVDLSEMETRTEQTAYQAVRLKV